jgi:hypothetical protein
MAPARLDLFGYRFLAERMTTRAPPSNASALEPKAGLISGDATDAALSMPQTPSVKTARVVSLKTKSSKWIY